MGYVFIVHWTESNREIVRVRAFQDLNTATYFRHKLQVLCDQMVQENVEIDGDTLFVNFLKQDRVSEVDRHDIY